MECLGLGGGCDFYRRLAAIMSVGGVLSLFAAVAVVFRVLIWVGKLFIKGG